MTKHEDRQRIKNEALNKIRWVYNERCNGEEYFDQYDESSLSEQKERYIARIIDSMNASLDEL